MHDYISELLDVLCPSKQIRAQLWDSILLDKLRAAYHHAMAHARFLLAMERDGRPTTFNHYFNANLQRKRNERLAESLKKIAVKFNDGYVDGDDDGDDDLYIPLSQLSAHASDKDNAQQICEDVVDTLASYYKVARKRFVDTICQQVVNNYLLDSKDSPLHVFSPELVMGLEPEQLEMIAGEDTASKYQRQVLSREMENLEAAMKVLRI